MAPSQNPQLERNPVPSQQPGLVTKLENLDIEDKAKARSAKQTIIPVNEKDRIPSASKSSQESQAGIKGQVIHIGPSEDPYSETVASRNALQSQPNGTSSSQSSASEPSSTTPKLISQERETPEFALGRSEDVQTHTRQAPTVTHETRIVNTHEIITKPITREIHNHHIVHRMQPIDDVDVLPPRHFILSRSGDGTLEEIAPPKISKGLQDRVSDAFHVHMEEARAGQPQTVKRFRQGNQRKEWTSPEGVECSESVWVHEPQLATDARDAGETIPVHVERPGRGDSAVQEDRDRRPGAELKERR